jgi:ribosome biogenesis GTPase
MSVTNTKSLPDLGYNAYFEAARKDLNLESFVVARVIVEYRGAYKVRNENGEYLAKVTGKQMFEAESREDYPAVGDWVAISDLDGENAAVRGILPRKTMIKRISGDKDRAGLKNETQIIATNIDVAFIVESLDRDFNHNRFERYFAIAREGGVEPAIILNKIDLIPSDALNAILTEIKERFGNITIITTSTVNKDGLLELKRQIEKGKTYCFLGSSGVGKSSLINKLLGENVIKTESIGNRTGRGKHTTTNREMYFLDNGAIVIDNPGMREVGIADAVSGVNDLFSEIETLAKECKFADCAHVSEPGCKVLAELKSGKLDAEKYESYMRLKKEAEYHELSELEKLEKDKQFGKFVKSAKKDLKKNDY